MQTYIPENLRKIIHSNNVLYFKTGVDIKQKAYLYAMVRNDNGSYQRIPLTIPDKISAYYSLNNPLYYSLNHPLLLFFKCYSNLGCLSSDDFIVRRDDVGDVYAINKKYYRGIGYCKCHFNPKLIEIYAIFNDDSTTIIDIQKKSKFMKKGIKIYEAAIIENSKDESRNHIEGFLQDNEAIIPGQKDEKEVTYVKKKLD